MKLYRCTHPECESMTIQAIDKLSAAMAYADQIGLDSDFADDLRQIKVVLIEQNNLK